MSDLTERGYLDQPHTSAGRVPTATAYREYVGALMRVRGIGAAQRSRIEGLRLAGRGGGGQPESLFQLAVRTLADVSPYVGLIVTPRPESAVLDRLELVPIDERKLVAVLVTRGGGVQHRVVTLDFDATRADIEHFHNYLNTWMRGLTLRQIRDRIRRELEEERAAADKMVRAALLTGREALATSDFESDVYIEGKARLLEMTDFESLDKLRPVLLALERKEGWLRLLEQSLSAPELRLHIGASAVADGLEECSVITAPYGCDDDRTGALGLIGPLRMDYARMIPLVKLTASMLSEALAVKTVM